VVFAQDDPQAVPQSVDLDRSLRQRDSGQVNPLGK
jgi:hypothetical protein